MSRFSFDEAVRHPVDHLSEHVIVHVGAGDFHDMLDQGLIGRAVPLDADQLDDVGVRGIEVHEDVRRPRGHLARSSVSETAVASRSSQAILVVIGI